jgi:hypothetical protein
MSEDERRMAKKKDELESFRIADKKRPEVKSFAPGKAGGGGGDDEAPSNSVGFPGIESRLENGTIDDFVDEIRPSYEKLEELAEKGDAKKKQAAKKAMAAYERVADLFEYLFETKAALQGSGQK